MKFLLYILLFIKPLAIGFGGTSTANSKTGATSFTNAYSAFAFSWGVGTLMVAAIAMDNIATGADGDVGDVTSVTDNAGNTYTKIQEFSNTQGAAGGGATISVWYCILTNAIVNTNTITFNFNGASVTAKAWLVSAFTIVSGNQISLENAGTIANDNTDPGSITLSGMSAVREYLLLRFTAIEAATGTAVTASTNFTRFFNTTNGTTGGGGATNMSIMGEYRIVSGSTSYSTDPTIAAADCASIMIGLYEFTPAPVTRRITYIMDGKP